MLIAFVVIIAVVVLSAVVLRRQAVAWAERTQTMFEVILGSVIAWVVFLSILSWLMLIVVTAIQFLEGEDFELLWSLLLNVLIIAYIANFLIQSRHAIRLDDTYHFFQKSLAFRRTGYQAVDVRALAEKEREARRRKQHREAELLKQEKSDPQYLERLKLEDDLQQRRRQDLRLKNLRDGETVDITDEWNARTGANQKHLLYGSVAQVHADGTNRRIVFVLDLRAFDRRAFERAGFLADISRELYDFLQSIMTELWLKAYLQPCPLFDLTCRGVGETAQGSEILFPFLRLQVTPGKLDELAASFFQGSLLPEAIAITFDNGQPV